MRGAAAGGRGRAGGGAQGAAGRAERSGAGRPPGRERAARTGEAGVRPSALWLPLLWGRSVGLSSSSLPPRAAQPALRREPSHRKEP